MWQEACLHAVSYMVLMGMYAVVWLLLTGIIQAVRYGLNKLWLLFGWAECEPTPLEMLADWTWRKRL